MSSEKVGPLERMSGKTQQPAFFVSDIASAAVWGDDTDDGANSQDEFKQLPPEAYHEFEGRREFAL